MEVADLLNALARSTPDVFFVQIGAADGITGDHLHAFVKKYKWSGLLVEPVPYLFEQLKKNYDGVGGHLVFENVAISDRDEVQDFWYPRQQADRNDLPPWYQQLGSFSRDTILKHSDRIPDLEAMLEKQPVQCLTLDRLLERYAVAHVDYLQIDTEGHDYDVLKQLDFSRFQPRVIIYEHKHLQPDAVAECESFLRSHSYLIIRQQNGNSIAHLK